MTVEYNINVNINEVKEDNKEESVDDKITQGVEGLEKDYSQDNLADKTAELEDQIKGIHSQIGDIQGKVGTATSLLANPTGIVSKIAPALTAAGPFGLAIGAVIAGGTFATLIAEQVISEFSKKGRFLNRDYHDHVGDILNGLFDRADIKERLLGESSAILYSGSGFNRVSDAEVYNSLVDLDSKQLSTIPVRFELERYS